MKGFAHPAERQLVRGIRALLAADPLLGPWLADPVGGTTAGRLTLEAHVCEPWASLTYEGHRHLLAILLSGEEAQVQRAHDRVLSCLTEPDVALEGRFLAEFQLGEREGELSADGGLSLSMAFEALTIDE